jgi:hypothetical protein
VEKKLEPDGVQANMTIPKRIGEGGGNRKILSLREWLGGWRLSGKHPSD